MIVALGLLAGAYMAVWQFMVTYVLVYVSEHMGSNPLIIGLVGSMQSIGFIVGLLFIMPRIELARSYRGALIVAPIISALVLKLLFSASSVGLLMVLYVIYNVNVAIFLVSVYSIVSDIMPPNEWGSGISKFRAITGLVMVATVIVNSRLASQQEILVQAMTVLLMGTGLLGVFIVPRAPLIPQRSIYQLDVFIDKLSRMTSGLVMASGLSGGALSYYRRITSYALGGGIRLAWVLIASLVFKMGIDSIMVQIPPIAASTVGSRVLFTAVALGLAGYTVAAYAADRTGNGKMVMILASIAGIAVALILGGSLHHSTAFIAVYTLVYSLLGLFDVESASLALKSDPTRIRFQPIAVNAGAIMGDLIGGLVIVLYSPSHLVYFSAAAFALAVLLWKKI